MIDVDKLFTTPLNWSNRYDVLLLLPHRAQVQFAVFCAEQVFELNSEKNKPTIKRVIDTVKLWLEGKASAKECKSAAEVAVYTAVYTAVYAANAAANATYIAKAASVNANAAANAANAAANAANAANAAAYAANAAVAAANAANAAELRSTLIQYLRELVIDNLSLEDKDNWLLITSI